MKLALQLRHFIMAFVVIVPVGFVFAGNMSTKNLSFDNFEVNGDSAEYVLNSSSSEALQLLDNMTQAFSILEYDGVFVHFEEMNMNSMRIRHELMDGVEYESLEDLDGDKVEVLRIDDSIVCVYSDASVANLGAPSSPPFKRLKDVKSDRLMEGYEMIVGPHMKRIAGRDALLIQLIPKDEYRYGHKLWLDHENHFLLKHDMIKKDGTLLERIQFTSVNFSPDLKPDDFDPKKGSYSKSILKVSPRFVKNLWEFDWLPEGFSLIWPKARAINHATSMLLLSDGMATVSVFIEPIMKTKTTSIYRTGATIAGESSFVVKDQAYLLTMVGEVPKATIEKLMMVFMPRPDND